MINTLTSTSAGYGIYAVQTVVVLALICGAAFVLVRFVLPRFGRFAGKSRMRVVDRLYLEPRKALYIVEVDGTELCIGVSDGGVRLIDRLERAEPCEGTGKDSRND